VVCFSCKVHSLVSELECLKGQN